MLTEDNSNQLKYHLKVALLAQAIVFMGNGVAPAFAYENSNTPQAQLERAIRLHDQGKDHECQQLLLPLSRRQDSTPEIHCLMAETYLDDYQEDVENSKAVQNHLRLALEKDPKCARAYKCLAEYYNASGDYKRAIENSTMALKLPKPDMWALRQRAIAYSNVGQYDKALADIDRFIPLDKATAYSYNLRAGILEKMKHYSDAAAAYRKALSVHHDDLTLYSITRCLQADHKYAEAIEAITSLIKINPQDAEALAVRGKLQTANNNPQQALMDFSQAITLEPSARLYKLRAAVYQTLGQKQAAERDLTAAAKLDASNF